MSKYHVPVMLSECIDGLAIKPDGVYIDLTFGGGGHTKEILKHLTTGKLFSFDQDADAVENAKQIDHSGFTLVETNFRFLRKYLRLYGIKKVDGVLADLGISSHQIDVPDRGFSFRSDADLDMRMDQSAEKDAKFVINTYSEGELHKIFGIYGELKNAKSLAARIASQRFDNEITTVNQFLDAIEPLISKKTRNKYLAQVFQAIRIEVNDEIKSLEEVLVQLPHVLEEDGRVVVMSYHSLEDRLVKNFIAKGKFYGEVEKDMYGNMLKPLDPISRKPITASADELSENPRSRSAKLRIAKRNSQPWEKTE